MSINKLKPKPAFFRKSLIKGWVIIFLTSLLFSPVVAAAQSTQATDSHAAVLNMETQDLDLSPNAAGNLLRMELEKINHYMVLDRYETQDILEQEGIGMEECYGRRCLVEAGEALGVDKVISGTAEHFGNRIVITVRKVDVASGEITNSAVTEYLDFEDELPRMIRFNVKELVGHDFNEDEREPLLHVEPPIAGEHMQATYSGPRIGVNYLTGNIGRRIQDSEQHGGFDGFPVMGMFGYQHEMEYMSAGNFHALFEGLVMASGMEQGRFVPTLVLMNGFRETVFGFEIAFGPSFSVSRTARGAYDGDGIWRRADYWEDHDPDRVLSELPDRDGNLTLTAGWVWAIGHTFRSGHLNIPVHAFAEPGVNGWNVGLSVGFNLGR